MVQKKVKRTLSIVGIILFLAVLAIYGSQSFAVFQGGQVWLPEFGRLKCDVYPLNIQLGQVPKGGASFVCGSNAYIPNSCSYHVSSGTSYSALECERDSDVCKTIRSGLEITISRDEKTFTIPSGKRLFIKPFIVTGNINVRETANSYRLHQIDSGFEIIDPKGCKLVEARSESFLPSDDRNNVQTQNYQGEIYMAPDTLFHYISKLTPSLSKNVVTIQGINSGEPIYIYDLGRYYPIVTVKEGEFKGQLVADTWSPKEDDRIKCLPAGDFCSSDATKIVPTEKKCSESGGLTGEYKPTLTVNRYCTLACNKATGLIDYTNDCKTINPCPPDKPLRDPRSLECVSGSTPGLPQEKTDLTPLYIMGIAFLLVLILVLIYQRTRGNKR